MKLHLTSTEERWSCDITLTLTHSYTGTRNELITYLEETHKLQAEVNKLLGLKDNDLDPTKTPTFPEYTWEEWEQALKDNDPETHITGYVPDHDDAHDENTQMVGMVGIVHPALRFGTGGVSVEAYHNEEEPDAIIDIQLNQLRDQILQALDKSENWKTTLADGGTWKLETTIIIELNLLK